MSAFPCRGVGKEQIIPRTFSKQIQRPAGALGQVMKGEPRASKKVQESYRDLPLSPLAQVKSLESRTRGCVGEWEPGMVRGERNVLCGELGSS